MGGGSMSTIICGLCFYWLPVLPVSHCVLKYAVVTKLLNTQFLIPGKKYSVMWVMIASNVNSTSLVPSSFLNFLTRSFLLHCCPFRREHWKLLSSLKTTVEGLVSTNNPNVWSRYGGLQRLHKDMNNILSHGLKNEQVGRSDWHSCRFCIYLFFCVC